MTKRNLFGISIAATLLVAAFGYDLIASREEKQSVVPQKMDVLQESIPTTSLNTKPIDTTIFADQARFEAYANVTSTPVDGRIVAGTVNHHILATDLLARFFKTLRASRPDARRFIILSPDHYHVGRGPVSTHERPYRVGDQLVPIDTTSTQALLTVGAVTLENGLLFEQEHGVGALVSFLVNEFPDANVLPLALSGTMEREHAKSLGRLLASLADEHTILITSADMSHYLAEDDALRHDEVTLRWLEKQDATAFGRANDDYVDNGVAFIALDAFLKALNLKPDFYLLDHSISTRYGGDPTDTTSYINGFWRVRSFR